MEPLQEYVDEYRRQMEKGVIQKAYKGLMEYIMGLRTHLKTKYPDYSVSGSIYYGYMDMTYFSFFPESFKQRGLKVAIVFIHETCRFEIWLAGYNKQVQLQHIGNYSRKAAGINTRSSQLWKVQIPLLSIN